MTTYNNPVSYYIADLFAREDRPLRQAIEGSAAHGLPTIGVTAEEGRFLQFLARSCGAQRALEIGTLGGYSGIWIARGLAPGGKLITLERDPQHARVAQENFLAAGVAGQIEIRLGEARQSLQALASQQPFDFVFIDADKGGYRFYFEWALEHVRLGGVIAAHNALWYGKVFDPSDQEADTLAIRDFNRWVAQNQRVISTIFPGGDGTLVAVKIA
jgi:caffeoyl-CoA O-methyltransferase